MKTSEEILEKLNECIEEIHEKYLKTNDEDWMVVLDSQLMALYKIKSYILEEEE